MNELLRITGIRSVVLLGVCLVASGAVLAEDRIVSLSVQEKLGYEEIPVVRVEVELNTKRDLHVSFQTWATGNR